MRFLAKVLVIICPFLAAGQEFCSDVDYYIKAGGAEYYFTKKNNKETDTKTFQPDNGLPADTSLAKFKIVLTSQGKFRIKWSANDNIRACASKKDGYSDINLDSGCQAGPSNFDILPSSKGYFNIRDEHGYNVSWLWKGYQIWSYEDTHSEMKDEAPKYQPNDVREWEFVPLTEEKCKTTTTTTTTVAATTTTAAVWQPGRVYKRMGEGQKGKHRYVIGEHDGLIGPGPCAKKCTVTQECRSFGYIEGAKWCGLYGVHVAELETKSSAGCAIWDVIEM